ncbi:MAG: hypothetical protein ACP5HG_00915 [Anaerolineae bacterium]
MSPDDLFREIFRSMAEATPPDDAWQGVVRSLAREAASPLPPVSKVLSWVQGFQSAYRHTSDAFVCAQPYGRYGLSPWGIVIAQ